MDRSDRKILIIDSDDIVRETIAAGLGQHGYVVVQEKHGSEALMRIHEHHCDAVITELKTEDDDGLTVLENIRIAYPELPVIVLSGVGVVGDVVRALRLGANDYFMKPLVDLDELVEVLEKAFKVRKLAEQNEHYRKQLELVNADLARYVEELERDQQAGRLVQSKLLPQTPVSFGSCELDYKMIPSLYLSGDFIDYSFIDQRYVAFYLADVSGHGAAPAFATVWLKLTVQRLLRDSGAFQSRHSIADDLGRLVVQVNQQMVNSKFSSHLTCFVGIIDTETRELYYLIGGHLPMPILVTKNGSNRPFARYLEGKGKPIGIFPQTSWEIYSITLPYEYRLVVLSDGVLEVLQDSELVDKENTLAKLTAGSGNSISELLAQLGVNDSTTPPDDISIFQIRSGGDI